MPTTPTIDWNDLADRALAGELLSRDEARAVLAAPDDALLAQLAAAYRVRRHHWGNRVRLHFLLNAQSGLCPEDCGYCSQSKVSAAEIEKYPMLARERILDAAERAVALKEAGVTQVNHNLNTSARYTPEVVSTHTFDDRVATVEHVKAAGLKTRSGGIVGMGESDDDVIDLALSLRALDVRSVPVNFLIPVPGTPFADVRGLDPRRCLRVLCLYRFLLPSQEIRIAGGREVHLRSMQPMGLYAANSIFIGDYLTTQGAAARADMEMIR